MLGQRMDKDPLSLNIWKADEISHIQVKNDQVCAQKCPEKLCTIFCPSQVYEWEEDEQRLKVDYPRCLECGACYYGCPQENIDFTYPRGGYGVQHRF